MVVLGFPTMDFFVNLIFFGEFARCIALFGVIDFRTRVLMGVVWVLIVVVGDDVDVYVLDVGRDEKKERS